MGFCVSNIHHFDSSSRFSRLRFRKRRDVNRRGYIQVVTSRSNVSGSTERSDWKFIGDISVSRNTSQIVRVSFSSPFSVKFIKKHPLRFFFRVDLFLYLYRISFTVYRRLHSIYKSLFPTSTLTHQSFIKGGLRSLTASEVPTSFKPVLFLRGVDCELK